MANPALLPSIPLQNQVSPQNSHHVSSQERGKPDPGEKQGLPLGPATLPFTPTSSAHPTSSADPDWLAPTQVLLPTVSVTTPGQGALLNGESSDRGLGRQQGTAGENLPSCFFPWEVKRSPHPGTHTPV